jgi:hypothetical protein
MALSAMGEGSRVFNCVLVWQKKSGTAVGRLLDFFALICRNFFSPRRMAWCFLMLLVERRNRFSLTLKRRRSSQHSHSLDVAGSFHVATASDFGVVPLLWMPWVSPACLCLRVPSLPKHLTRDRGRSGSENSVDSASSIHTV